MNKLAKNIRKLRKADGLSQEDFAEKVGVTRQTVSKWENDGEIKSTNIDNICKVYNISSEQLMGDNDFKILTINHETGKIIKGAFSKNEESNIIENDENNIIKNDENNIIKDNKNDIIKNDESNIIENYKSNIIEDDIDVNFTTESKIRGDKIKGDTKNRILFQNSKIRNPYIYPTKSKRHKIRKIIKKLIILVLILYVLVSLYKFFVICFIIHKQQQYKNANNYYEEISICINNIANEKDKIWYKDGICKIETIIYDDAGNCKENYIKYFNDKLNELITIDKLDNTVKTERLNDDFRYFYSNSNFPFYEFPEIFGENKLNLLKESLFNFSFKVNLQSNYIFLFYNSNKIEIDKKDFLPVLVTDNNKLNKEVYYKYEFNLVTDKDVFFEK